MKFSIVTISFNQREFLSAAIESVLQQRDQGVDLEYIVVDPGSTDGSRDVIDSYGREIDHRIFESDSGPAHGLNLGFARATGEVFGYLNSDDELLPGSLATVNAYLQRNPAVDVVLGCGWKAMEETGKRKLVAPSLFTQRRYVEGAAVFLQQATFVSAEAFQKVHGFNVSNRTCWDSELMADLSTIGASFGVLNRPLAVFRIHGESISGSGRLEEQYREDLSRIRGRLATRPLAPPLAASVRNLARLERIARRIVLRARLP